MPSPTNSQVHVDSALTNISVAYLQDSANFISRKAFPIVPVSKQSDKYFVYDRSDFNRNEAQLRAPGTESAGGGYKLGTASYACDVIAFHKDVPVQTAANQDVGDAYDDAARFVAHKMLIRAESDFASNYMTSGVWDNDYDGVASSPGTNEVIQWSDANNGNPIGDIRSAKTTVLSNTGFEPNTLIISQDVMDALVDHPDILDRVKYSGGVGNGNPAIVNEQTLAALFGIERVLVSKAVVNSSAEDLTESSGFIVGKKALLCYAAPRPGLQTPSAGYTFTWNGYLGSGMNDMGVVMSRFFIDERKAYRVEGEMAYDQKVVSSALGFFWNNIVA